MPSLTEKFRQIMYARVAAAFFASSSVSYSTSVEYSLLFTRTVQV